MEQCEAAASKSLRLLLCVLHRSFATKLGRPIVFGLSMHHLNPLNLDLIALEETLRNNMLAGNLGVTAAQ